MDDVIFPWAWDEKKKTQVLAQVIAQGDLPKLMGVKE